MDSSKIKGIIFIIIAMFVAIYLGVGAATSQVEAVLWVVAGITLAVLLALGRNVWVVIPIAAAFTGGITLIPGFPQPWYAATPIVGVFMVIMFLMRSPMFTFRWTWLDTFMLLQAFALWQTYVRNPTGLALFGNDIFGGRPYFDYAVGITCYFLLSVVKTDIQTFKKVAILVIIANIGDDLLRAATNLSGNLSVAVGRFYSNVDYQSNSAGASFTFDADTRFGGFMPIGITLALVCFAFRRPLSCAIPKPFWPFLCAIAAVVFVLLSGFRSALIRVACYFIAGSLIRRKPLDIVAAAVAVTLLLFVTGATLGLSNLPMGAQRALSFLPFEVSDEAKYGAKASSDWRFEMWKIVLTSDKYIQNKLLGDGFGYSKAEHYAQMKAMEGTGNYDGDSIDMFIAKGSYHGWHVEAIRFTGVIGLIIGLFLLFGFARYAWKAVKHYRHSEYLSYVLFICIPFLIEPFFYIFVFGSYKSGFVELIASAGIIRLLDNIRVAELSALRLQAPEPDPIPRMQGHQRTPALTAQMGRISSGS
jgi:hypothetical protein